MKITSRRDHIEVGDTMEKLTLPLGFPLGGARKELVFLDHLDVDLEQTLLALCRGRPYRESENTAHGLIERITPQPLRDIPHNLCETFPTTSARHPPQHPHRHYPGGGKLQNQTPSPPLR